TRSVRVAGRLQPVHVVFDGPPGRPRSMWLDHAGFAGRVVDAGMLAVRRADTDARTELRAGMHGRLRSIAVAAGERACAGQTRLSIEAMKMEHRVVAPADGRRAALAVRAGTPVDRKRV